MPASTATTRIVVNADDLGISDRVNGSIFELMARGRISSATTLVNAPAFEAAVEGMRAFPDCSFGVHLNLTEFRPLTASPALAPLLRDGCFQGDLPWRVRPSRALVRAVVDEWSAQVERMIAAGRRPSHLDSHHHCHTLPWALPAVREVMVRHGIRSVRRSLDLYGPSETPSATLRAKKALWHGLVRVACRPRAMTARFSSFETYVQGVRDGRFGGFPSIELMTHPGHDAFESETRLLASDWLESMPFPVSLVSYDAL